MKTIHATVILSLLAAFQLGCPPKPSGTLHDIDPADYERPLPPGQLALRKLTDPADIPDFTPALANTAQLRQAIANSLNYLSKPSSKQYFPYGEITHEQVIASLQAFDALLASGQSPQLINAAIRQRFDVYTSVGWNGRGEVFFTGYYTPIFDASPVQTERFRYPLYQAPAELVKASDGAILGLKGADGQLRPVPARRELETSGMLAGLELVYLADPFEVYIAHVQGSAKLRMPDGNVATVGYAANNGHEYISVAKELVKDGQISAREISLQAMINYFKANPRQLNRYLHRNPRFVFFNFDSGGPFGSINEPVTAFHTIATDKSIYPRASLAFISTKLPRRVGNEVQMTPFRGFLLDQDTGGAIRAAGRGDIYMGVGDNAGELAGRMQEVGRLYYLFLKPQSQPRDVLTPAGQ